MNKLYSLIAVLTIVSMTTGCVEDVNIPNASAQGIESASPCQGNQGNGNGWGQIICDEETGELEVIDADSRDEDPVSITTPEVLYIGDENCIHNGKVKINPSSVQQMGVHYKCKKGRKMVDVLDMEIPSSETGTLTIVLALGMNDVLADAPTALNDFSSAYLHVFNNTDAQIICIIPEANAAWVNANGNPFLDYQNILYSTCGDNAVESSDLDEANVLYGHDGILMDQDDHNKVNGYLRNRLGLN